RPSPKLPLVRGRGRAAGPVTFETKARLVRVASRARRRRGPWRWSQVPASRRARQSAAVPSEPRDEEERAMETIETEHGRVRLNPDDVMLGELFVTDEGVELEVVGLDPLRFEPAPQEEEDW